METVLGVQFAPLKGLRPAHFGLFWKSLPGEWPGLIDAPAIEPQFEEFTETTAWKPSGIQLKLAKVPDLRLQIKNTTEDRMIQVQNDRFHYNWLLRPSGGTYPRYDDTIRPEFFRVFHEFEKFLEGEGFGAVSVNQWEITYVNHLPRGSVWKSSQEWPEVLPGLLGRIDPATSLCFEACEGEWHFQIPEQRGRLHLAVQRGRENRPDGDDLLILKLTARGPVLGSSLESGLDCGHQAIIDGFLAVTSEAAKAYWRPLHADNYAS